MNFRSSRAKTLVGSVIAMVSVAPTRLSGMIWYLWAVSAGTSLMTAGSISNWFSEIDGTPVLLGEQRRDLLVLHEAELHQIGAQLAAALALVAQRLLELFGRDPLLLEKQLANPYCHVVVSAVLRPAVPGCPSPGRPWLGGDGPALDTSTGAHDCTPVLRVPAPLTFSVCWHRPLQIRLLPRRPRRPWSAAVVRHALRDAAGDYEICVDRPQPCAVGPAPGRDRPDALAPAGSPSQSAT